MDITKETVLEAFAGNRQLSDLLASESLERFAEFAVEGSKLDPTFALRVLVNGYIDYCSVSAGFRTIYYDAGQYILDEFLKTDNPLAARLRNKGTECLCDCMEQFNDLYSKEKYGDYDITLLKMEAYPEMCMEECSYNIPKKQKAALCYGLYLMLTDDPAL